MNTPECNSVQDYLSLITEFNNLRKVHSNSMSIGYAPLFRGQSKFSWLLSPKLYRKEKRKKVGLLYEKESLLISEIIRRVPSEFSSGSRLEKLAKMQHYGLPTRLLDVTTNPLIALYFAVNEHDNFDGAIFIINNTPILREPYPTISVVMNFVFNYSGFKLEVDYFCKDIMSNQEYTAPYRQKFRTNEDILDELTLEYFGVFPTMGNSRMIAQDAAFLIFGMQKNAPDKYHDDRFLSFIPYILPERERSKDLNQLKIKIPKSSKGHIRKELHSFGISKGKLFPELEQQCAMVTEQIRSESFGTSIFQYAD